MLLAATANLHSLTLVATSVSEWRFGNLTKNGCDLL
jgi:hypothetical protein